MDRLSQRLEDLRKFVVCISMFLFLFKDASFESDITTEKVRGLKQIRWRRFVCFCSYDSSHDFCT
ncbi:hypothetical protein Hdeb2414_s0007g00242701 [Helianthus debilis subsp. tardiflorus]